MWHLREFLSAPYPAAFVFDGETGTGKSSMAVALGAELGCEIDEGAVGGFYRIASGEQTVDSVRELLAHLWTRPLMSRDGWKVVVVEEADRMSEAASYLWLSALEDIPPRCVFVFTTNHAARFPQRFLDRCERFTFESAADALMHDAQELVNTIWAAETGRDDAPRVCTIPGLVDAHGRLSFRRAVLGLVPLLRGLNAAHRVPPAADRPADTVAPKATPHSALPRRKGMRSTRLMTRSDVIPIATGAQTVKARIKALKKERATLEDQLAALGQQCLTIDDYIDAIDKEIGKLLRSTQTGQ